MPKIHLYTNQSDRKKINKTLEPFFPEDTGKTFRVKQDCSILKPEIVLSLDTIGKNYAICNYAYVPQWKRYYFINDITLESDGLIALSMEVDVLMSYKSNILSSKQEVIRSESLNSPLYIDNERPLQANKLLYSLKLGTFPEVSGNNYFLTVAGG